MHFQLLFLTCALKGKDFFLKFSYRASLPSVSHVQLFWLFEIYLNLFIYLLYLFLKSIDYALRFSQFSPLYPPLSPHPLPSSIPPPLSSCPCLVHISSLRSVSYTISMPPTLFMPTFILLLPCTFAPLFHPSPSPLKFLHVMSISLILFLF